MVCSRSWTMGARLGSLELARSVACPHCFPTDSSVSHKPDVECRWLLFQPWASCHQVTSSLGAPWLSVESGRRLCWGNPAKAAC